MSKTALYITFDGLSDPLGQSQILPYLRGLAAGGFKIIILSCDKPARIKKEEAAIRNSLADLPITWKYILYDEKGGLLSRWQYVLKLKSLAERARIEHKISLVHCRSYLAALIGLYFKRKYKIPFIFDMRGFWADERMDGNIWSRKNTLHQLMYLYFKRKEKAFLKEADAVVSLTTAGLNELNKNYPGIQLNLKTTVIPCCTDLEIFDPARVSEKSIRSEEKDHILIYTGSIGTWYYTREMIDCIISWKKHIPSIKLFILTKDQDELKNILDSYGQAVSDIVITASASYAEVPSYLKCASAAIFFIKPAYSKIASSPTKMAECWAMGLPIITNSGIGDNDLYFRKYSGGVLVEGFNEIEYQKSCSAYLLLQEKRTDYRKIASDHFDTSKAAVKYQKIYHQLSRS